MNNVDLSAGLGFVANDIVRPIIEPSRVRISDQNGFTTGIDHNSSPETSLPSKRGLAIRQARAKPLAGEHCMALIGVPSSDLRGCVALSDSPSPRPSFHTRLGLCTAALGTRPRQPPPRSVRGDHDESRPARRAATHTRRLAGSRSSSSPHRCSFTAQGMDDSSTCQRALGGGLTRN
jgi:hypothetical protein